MLKDRIDVILVERGLAPSREKAKVLVMAGQVYVGQEKISKPDKVIGADASIEIRGNPIPYVSFGGVKLEGAIRAFGLQVTGKRAMDIGSSTGGFVDCLLKFGATSVYAVDVGTHQLHESLRGDGRVTLKENLNARYLAFDDVGERFDLITIDVSFISLKKILPALIPFLNQGGQIISLVKPQFEVGRYEVGKGGIVKDLQKIRGVLEEIKAFGITLGIMPVAEVEAPREKDRKNREYFLLWEAQGHLTQ